MNQHEVKVTVLRHGRLLRSNQDNVCRDRDQGTGGQESDPVTMARSDRDKADKSNRGNGRPQEYEVRYAIRRFPRWIRQQPEHQSQRYAESYREPPVIAQMGSWG